MAQGVVRAAAYLPAFTDGARRVRGPDEDAFTLVAAALERLLPDRSDRTQGWTVGRLGAASGLDPELLSGVLGAPVRAAEPEAGPTRSLRGALDLALAGSRPELIVGAVVEAPEPDPAVDHAPPPGEGAFALLVDSLAAPGESLLPSDFEPKSGEELSALSAVATSARGAGRTGWVGDWDPNARAGTPPPSRPTSALGPRVSEGAYLPNASYREGIASRWRFEGERCPACGTTTFPARGRCRHCGRADGLVTVALPREGLRVVAVTWIGSGGQPTEFDEQVAASGPYGVALLELAPGVRATAALTEVAAPTVAIGSLVRTSLRRLYAIDGAWRYGRKAIPVSGA